MATHSRQMSDAFRTTVFLTLSGGFQDAYTYMGRGKVFANAQTGNIVLMATNFCEGDFAKALRYLLPLLAFAAGVYFAEGIRNRYHLMERFHWRQLILLIEIALLFVVGFIPNNLDWLANMLVSFVCAMQVQTFRKVRGHAYASTMCIGNMRSGTEVLCVYFSQDFLLPQIIGLGRTTVFSTPMFYAHSAASAICYSFFLFQ